MSETNPAVAPTLTKQELETAILQEQLAQARRPWWANAGMVGAVLAFLVSLGFNILQHRDRQRELEQRGQEISIAVAKSEAEVAKLRAEVKRLEDVANMDVATRTALQSELQDVQAAIKTYAAMDEQYFLGILPIQNALNQHKIDLTNSKTDSERRYHQDMITASEQTLAELARLRDFWHPTYERALRRREEIQKRLGL